MTQEQKEIDEFDFFYAGVESEFGPHLDIYSGVILDDTWGAISDSKEQS